MAWVWQTGDSFLLHSEFRNQRSSQQVKREMWFEYHKVAFGPFTKSQFAATQST
jgi:hypothetical protein